jgi:hypothetical protein
MLQNFQVGELAGHKLQQSILARTDSFQLGVDMGIFFQVAVFSITCFCVIFMFFRSRVIINFDSIWFRLAV